MKNRYDPYLPLIGVVGLRNFEDLAAQDLLVRPLLLTVTYAVVGMVAQNAVGLALALILEGANRVNVFFRSVFFTPVLLSSVAVGFVWRGYLAPSGPANAIPTDPSSSSAACRPPRRRTRVAWMFSPTTRNGVPERSGLTIGVLSAWRSGRGPGTCSPRRMSAGARCPGGSVGARASSAPRRRA